MPQILALQPRQSRLRVRGLQINIQEWGNAKNPRLFLLHGWMDCGASFQFIAPYLKAFHIVAPDWRGFGESEHATGGYWFPDYFADLEIILQHFNQERPANLVGHSMGGNIALMYAGIKPQRVARVISLEALGLPATKSEDAVDKYRNWMKDILSNTHSKCYANWQQLGQSIANVNPRLNDEMVSRLCRMWGRETADGGVELKHDHRHRYVNPVRYQHDDVEHLWAQITAEVCLVLGEQSAIYQLLAGDGRVAAARRILRVKDENYHLMEAVGHMLHLEQPQVCANLIERFFAS